MRSYWVGSNGFTSESVEMYLFLLYEHSCFWRGCCLTSRPVNQSASQPTSYYKPVWDKAVECYSRWQCHWCLLLSVCTRPTSAPSSEASCVPDSAAAGEGSGWVLTGVPEIKGCMNYWADNSSNWSHDTISLLSAATTAITTASATR